MSQYQYELPEELIASSPREPRDSAKLLIVDAKTGKISIDTFLNIDAYLSPQSLLVLNKTKVVPARVMLYKETRGKAEVLFLANEYGGGSTIRGIADRKLVVGQRLSVKPGGQAAFAVVAQHEAEFEFELLFPPKELPIFFETHGAMPVPKYLGKIPLSEKAVRDRYQTVFADKPSSVAAPTASLHFTPRVFEKLHAKNITDTPLYLHVGLGTFAPVRPENIAEKKLHKEAYEIPMDTMRKISAAKEDGRQVIAVGTTVVRALESITNTQVFRDGAIGTTDIFIHPSYDFRVPDALITNFHLPESSLMCLVDAFLQYKKCPIGILDVYCVAIENKFHFYSFGDSMLII